MRECWSAEPLCRPNFSSIVGKFMVFNGIAHFYTDNASINDIRLFFSVYRYSGLIFLTEYRPFSTGIVLKKLYYKTRTLLRPFYQRIFNVRLLFFDYFLRLNYLYKFFPFTLSSFSFFYDREGFFDDGFLGDHSLVGIR